MKYSTKKYSARDALRKFSNSSYYRQKAYESYSKAYDRLFPKYGKNMAAKLSKQTFYRETREELITAAQSESKYKFTGARIAESQIFETLKEGRSGARNFNRNIEELNYRTQVDPNISNKEISFAVDVNAILAKYGRTKLTSTDIRTRSEVWEEILKVMKKYDATDKTMGSK